MLLTKIILQDYGVYRGKNEFDFTCTKDKPVILIGGTNGAGKTTLFESVMLCLYGAYATGNRSTKKSYEQMLAKRIHRYAGSSAQADFASITVQFVVFHSGKEIEYRVNRVWKKSHTGIDEQLLVHKRHSQEQFLPLDTVEESYWQSFIKDLIPKGVANLFFFDGEKIVKIAKEEKEDFAIKESFKSLLGLDVVEQLQTDLQTNMMKNLVGGESTLQDEYDRYKKEREEYNKTNTMLQERLAQKQNEFDSLQMKIEGLESSISKIGGEFASARESAKSNLVEKKTIYSTVEKRMYENCATYLPFSLIPELLDSIKSSIEEDQAILQERLGSSAVIAELDKIRSKIESKEFFEGLKMDNIQTDSMRERLLGLFTGKRIQDDKNELFGFSSIQAARILHSIHEANHSALSKLSADTRELVDVGREIEMLERTLASAASDDEVGPMVSELGRLNSTSGELRAEMNHMEEKLSSNMAMRTHIDAKLRGIVKQMYQNEKSKDRVVLTQNVQSVLDEFLEKIKSGKLQLLEQYLLEGTQLLMHKKRFIEKITIDPDTFQVSLYDGNDQPIPKDMISEGEKQMFATAILWALARTSGKSLPFMIDTPLARLDGEHRTNIVGKFLPFASHQVIVFSTNKEIEHEYYEMLKPYISKSYVLRFSEDGTTRSREGYFWNELGEKISAI